jgi:hypothetical protein
MTQELVRYVLLASASATVVGVVFEPLRRRLRGVGSTGGSATSTSARLT